MLRQYATQWTITDGTNTYDTKDSPVNILLARHPIRWPFLHLPTFNFGNTSDVSITLHSISRIFPIAGPAFVASMGSIPFHLMQGGSDYMGEVSADW
jgi:hypothetical protein